MKITNKRKLQQIAFNHFPDIDFQDLRNLYEKCRAKPYSFLVIDTTLISDNRFRFRKNHVERIQKVIMTTDEKIRDEKSQYDVNREVEKNSALSSGKIDKQEYLPCKEILPFDQSGIKDQAKFT